MLYKSVLGKSRVQILSRRPRSTFTLVPQRKQISLSISHNKQSQYLVGCHRLHPQRHQARGTEEAEEEAGDMVVGVVEEGVAPEEAGGTEVGVDEVRYHVMMQKYPINQSHRTMMLLHS